MSDGSKILIIAGPNGAGKTTFAREYLPQEAACPDFINADLMAAGLSPFHLEAAAMRAGRLVLEQIRDRVRRGRRFAFETTLSGLSYARQIPVWQAAGYHVRLTFLQLPSVELAHAQWRHAWHRAGMQCRKRSSAAAFSRAPRTSVLFTDHS